MPPETSTCDVLIVDDNEAMTDSVANLLELFGLSTRSATSGSEALAMLSSGVRPRLVLLDSHMPETSGLVVLDAISADPVLCNIPIVMMTADDDLHPLPVAGTLRKPFGGDALRQAVWPFVRKSRIDET